MNMIPNTTGKFAVSALCVMSLTLGSCNRSLLDASVQGAVTIDGELAKSGSIVFTPETGGPISTGSISADGSFSLRTGQGDLRKVDGGLLASGTYSVSVSIFAPSKETLGEGGPPKPGPMLIASKYSNNATSGLKVDVKPGKNVINLELEGADSTPSPVSSFEDLKETTELEEEAPPTEISPDAVPPTEAVPSVGTESEKSA